MYLRTPDVFHSRKAANPMLASQSAYDAGTVARSAKSQSLRSQIDQILAAK